MLLYGLAFAMTLHPASLRACAACYGQSDSPLAVGMNWGIFSLLVIVVAVLGGIAGFFIFLARRATLQSSPPDAGFDPALASHRPSFTD
jgi:hypothetical protein